MAEGDGTFYKAVILLGVTFGVGFFTGYKVIFECLVGKFSYFFIHQAKELRMEWLKRRRERLAVKLAETQREIESMKAH